MQKVITPTIKRCWCGEDAHIKGGWKWDHWQVMCNNKHTLTRECSTVHRAICRWNNRTNDKGIKIKLIVVKSPVISTTTLRQRELINKITDELQCIEKSILSLKHHQTIETVMIDNHIKCVKDEVAGLDRKCAYMHT